MNWKRFDEIIDKTIKVFEVEGVERISLWDDVDKKYIQQETEITLKDGSIVKWDQYVKIPEDDKNRYRRVVSYNREIFVDDDNYMCGFKQSVELKLKEINELLKSTGQPDITHQLFKITKKGKGKETRYTTSIVKQEVEDTEQLGTTEEGVPTGASYTKKMDIETPVIEKKLTAGVKKLDPHMTDLNDTEKKLFETYKDFIRKNNHKVADENVKSGIVKGLIDNGVEEKRAEWIYSEYFMNFC